MNDLIYRAWFYFRMGYAVYIALILGVTSNVIIIYKLALENIPLISEIHLTGFLLVTLPLGTIICTGIGWLHMRKSKAYLTDAKVTVDNSPYNYKAVSGKERDLQIPVQIFSLRKMKEFYTKYECWTPEDEKEFIQYTMALQRLKRGETIRPTERSEVFVQS